MSIQSEITRITNNVQDTIDVIEQTGVSIPAGANSDNLPSLAQALANDKQDKLAGSQGQFVGFTADNVVGAVDAPAGLPSGGTPGQMLYQGESGPEWGIPPYLGSMPQLDYSQMKSLHALGITDLNDVMEPGTYVGMQGAGYPLIENIPVPPVGEIVVPFILNVYSLTGPAGTTFAGYSVSIQELFYIGDTIYGFVLKFWRAGYTEGISSDPSYEFVGNWIFESDAKNIILTPGTSGLTSTNVQDAIEEVNEKIPAKPIYRTVTLTAAGWSSNTQTVTVQGVETSGQSVRISPATKTDADNWVAAGVWCSEPTTANQLVFTCDTAPTENININVELQEVQS